jgi:hypothetical protein
MLRLSVMQNFERDIGVENLTTAAANLQLFLG